MPYRKIAPEEHIAKTAVCTKCKVEKPVERFAKRKIDPLGRSSQCLDCLQAYMQAYYEKHKATGKWKLYSRRNGLKKYGLTEEDYEQILESQQGGCAICGNQQGRMHTATGEPRHLAVDHNHETLVRRGLLCDDCNQAIGLFRDDPNLLIAAAAYLMRYEEVQAEDAIHF